MSTENTNQNIQDSVEISLKDLILKIREWFRYLLSKWLIILGFGILGGILGFVYAYTKRPIYTATTTFVLEEGGSSGGGLGQYAGLASMVGIDIGGGSGGLFQGDNILELYKSRSMLEKTLLSEIMVDGKKQLLIEYYIKFNRLKELWANNSGLKNLNFGINGNIQISRLQDSIVGIIVNDINKNYLNVSKLDKKSSIIKVTVNSQNEFFAKTFNDQIVKNVNDFYIQTRTRKSLENLAILQHQTDSVRSVMNGAIYSSAATIDATPNLNPTRQVLRTPIQKSQFTADANKAILSELIKNLELSKITLRKETPLIQEIDKPIFPLDAEILGLKKGFLIGLLLAGFLTIICLTIRLFFKNIVCE